jgi:hypothetical protein
MRERCMRGWVVALALVLWPSIGRPDGHQAPLPDSESFLAKTRDRLATNALLLSRYTYKERRSEIRTNPFGRIGTGTLLVYEVFPSVDPEMTYRRLVERDGRPVPAAEIARQDHAHQVRYLEWRRKLARETADERSDRLRRQADEERRQRELASETLGLFKFTLDRRDTWQGRPAIVVRFEPKLGARPRSRESRVASVFVGQAWIHETEHQLMHLEAGAVDDVSFGFGMIARLHEGAKALVTRTEVSGVWLPSETRFAGTGRALMFRKVTIDYLREYFDYRPFNPADPPPIPGLGSSGSR